MSSFLPLLVLAPSLVGGSLPGASNDLCANATPITDGQSLPFSTVGAQVSSVVPGCSLFGSIMGPDVWFRYDAIQDGLLTVDVCQDTNFDSVVAIYEAALCEDMPENQRGCNDDFCGTSSSMQATVRAGSTYRIQVGGFSNADFGTGTVSVSFQPGLTVPFDDCAGAGLLVSGVPVSADAVGASFEPGEPTWSCSYGPTLGSVWYRFVAQDSSALVSAYAPDPFVSIDPLIAVYAGTCGSLTELACNDLIPGTTDVRALVDGLTVGQSYYVQVSVHLGTPSGAMAFPPPTLLVETPAPCDTFAYVRKRVSAPNPDVYTIDGDVLLGAQFEARVELGTATTSALFAFDTPTFFALGGGQILFAWDGGSGEMFTGAGLQPFQTFQGIDRYRLDVPNDPALCSVFLYSQAVRFGSGSFELTNAQDIALGY